MNPDTPTTPPQPEPYEPYPMPPSQPGNVVSPGPLSNPAINSPDLSPTGGPSVIPPAPFTTSQINQPLTTAEPPKTGGRFSRFSKKKALLLVVLPILVLGGIAAAYFGYYLPNQPANLWRNALANTGKGYDRLVDYATTQKNIKSVDINGSFKFTGASAADGTFNGTFSQGNGRLTETGSGFGLKTNLELRWIKSPGNTADIYFKLSGVEGLGDLVASITGDPNLKKLNDINGRWYVIDHSLFDELAAGSNNVPQISQKDVRDLLVKIGDTSKKYLFTKNDKMMAIVVKQNVGKEQQDGRSTYHYKVGYNKQNMQAYFKELCGDVNNSGVKKFAQAFDASGTLGCDSTSLSYADQLNESDSADVWVDISTKLIHKIRFTEKNKTDNYQEIGQSYTGGDSYPFFINFHRKDGNSTDTAGINLTLNMKANSLTVQANFKSELPENGSGNFSLEIKPAPTEAKIEAPSDARNIIQLLNDLGFGDYFNEQNKSSYKSIESRARDTERKTDIKAIQANVEAYYADHSYYPTLANLNDQAWRNTNMKGLDPAAFQDPQGSSQTLAATAGAHVYAYQTTPAGCNNSKLDCQNYTLTATLEAGGTFQLKSVNSPNPRSY